MSNVNVITYTDEGEDNRGGNLEGLINEVIGFDDEIETIKKKRNEKIGEIKNQYPELFQGSECEAVTKNYRTNFKRRVTNRFDGKELFKKFDTAIRDGKLTALPSYLKLSIDRKKLLEVCTQQKDYDPKLGLAKHKGWQSIMQHCTTTTADNVEVKIQAVIGSK